MKHLLPQNLRLQNQARPAPADATSSKRPAGVAFGSRTVSGALTAFLLLATLPLLGSCDFGPPRVQEEAQNRVQYYVNESRSSMRTRLLQALDQADERAWVATSRLEDEGIADAIIAARERGLDVRVVSDIDHVNDAGFQKLISSGFEPVYVTQLGYFDKDDQPVERPSDYPLVFGDGSFGYLPEPTLGQLSEECQTGPLFVECTGGQGDNGLVRRPGEFNLLSHTFMIIDVNNVYYSSTPLITGESRWVGWHAESQDITFDFEREFKQLHGGVFAVTLNAYNGPIKASSSNRPFYTTDDGHLIVRFNPQDRLIKRIIDEVFRARASIHITTDALHNEFLINALRYKKQNDFDVRVVLRQGSAYPPEVAELEPTFRDWDYVPTQIFIDDEPDRNGQLWPRGCHVLSHPLWQTQPYRVVARTTGTDDRLRIYPSDTFVDGLLWSFVETFPRSKGEGDSDNPCWGADAQRPPEFQ